jgi:phenylalanyl-tRNA synthetase beta chain
VEEAIKNGLPAERPASFYHINFHTLFLILRMLPSNLRLKCQQTGTPNRPPGPSPVYPDSSAVDRTDLLCIEGIARALRVFLRIDRSPEFKLIYPPGGKDDLLTITVSPEVGPSSCAGAHLNHTQTAQVRPLFAGAILRNIKFTPRSYASFIDLQDKLHQNICRRRQFVAIGTHDLDTLTPPFRYEARKPTDIKFVPLNKNKEYTAEELMTVYEVGAKSYFLLPPSYCAYK